MRQELADPVADGLRTTEVDDLGRSPWEPDEASSDDAPPDRPPAPHRGARIRVSQGFVVEFVRLIIVVLFAVAGWEIASSVMNGPPSQHLIGIVVGSGLGYVVGGLLGRQTASAVSGMEREFARVPAAELLAGTIGTTLGLGLATLLSLPLFHLPPSAAYGAVAFMYLTIGFLGYRVGRTKSEELFGLFGIKTRVAGTRPGEVSVLDSSAILDGRIASIIELGFLTGSLLVSRCVLDELQAVADSSNAARRARGRRALDLLVSLRRDPAVDLSLVDDAGSSAEAVDVRIVRLARARGAALVTNDVGLAKVAAALDVPVRSIHALAEALRPSVVPGERVSLRLTRAGREAGQAVGYLVDGTMVVVEGGGERVGDTVDVVVTNAIQTATGQLVFAELPTDDSAH
jgi:uncharacterized protein YacL